MLFAFACEKEDEIKEDEKSLIEIATAKNEQIVITIYAEENLFVGYNSVYAKVTDAKDNTSITNAEVTVVPMMTMMSTMGWRQWNIVTI